MKNLECQTNQKHLFAQKIFHKPVSIKVKGNVTTPPEKTAYVNIWLTVLKTQAKRRHLHRSIPIKHAVIFWCIQSKWIQRKMNSKRRHRQGVLWATGFIPKAIKYRHQNTKWVAQLYQPAFCKITVVLRRIRWLMQVLLHHPVLGPVLAIPHIKCLVKNFTLIKYVPQPCTATQHI